MRWLTRLTNAFNKKLEYLKAAVALHFAHHNLVRVHRTLRVTPAMAAGITDHLWSIPELMEATAETGHEVTEKDGGAILKEALSNYEARER